MTAMRASRPPASATNRLRMTRSRILSSAPPITIRWPVRMGSRSIPAPGTPVRYSADDGPDLGWDAPQVRRARRAHAGVPAGVAAGRRLAWRPRPGTVVAIVPPVRIAGRDRARRPCSRAASRPASTLARTGRGFGSGSTAAIRTPDRPVHAVRLRAVDSPGLRALGAPPVGRGVVRLAGGERPAAAGRSAGRTAFARWRRRSWCSCWASRSSRNLDTGNINLLLVLHALGRPVHRGRGRPACCGRSRRR